MQRKKHPHIENKIYCLDETILDNFFLASKKVSFPRRCNTLLNRHPDNASAATQQAQHVGITNPTPLGDGDGDATV